MRAAIFIDNLGDDDKESVEDFILGDAATSEVKVVCERVRFTRPMRAAIFFERNGDDGKDCVTDFMLPVVSVETPSSGEVVCERVAVFFLSFMTFCLIDVGNPRDIFSLNIDFAQN